MSAWLIPAALALVALVTARSFGLRWLMVGIAALALGAATLHQPTGGPAAPVPAVPVPDLVDPASRSALFGSFNAHDHWLIMADSFARRGKTEDSATILLSAVRAHPRDYSLWAAFGLALTDHAGRLTPAAELAFARARRIAPTAPGVDYYYGHAQRRSGDMNGARRTWGELLARSPAEAPWRPLVEDALRNP